MTKLTTLYSSGTPKLRYDATQQKLVLTQSSDQACCCDDKWQCCPIKMCDLKPITSVTLDITSQDYSRCSRRARQPRGEDYVSIGYPFGSFSGSQTLSLVGQSSPAPYSLIKSFSKTFAHGNIVTVSLAVNSSNLASVAINFNLVGAWMQAWDITYPSYYTGDQCLKTPYCKTVNEMTFGYSAPVVKVGDCNVAMLTNAFGFGDYRSFSSQNCSTATVDFSAIFEPYSFDTADEADAYSSGYTIDHETGSTTISVNSLTAN